MRVLRGMRADQADGLPAIGETGRYLGVRPGVDIPVAPDGFVDSCYGGDERRPAARGERQAYSSSTKLAS